MPRIACYCPEDHLSDSIGGPICPICGHVQYKVSAEEVRTFRARRSWSRPEMATAMGVAVRTIEEWEAGRSTPPAYLRLAVVAIERQLTKEAWNLSEREVRELRFTVSAITKRGEEILANHVKADDADAAIELVIKLLDLGGQVDRKRLRATPEPPLRLQLG